MSKVLKVFDSAKVRGDIDVTGMSGLVMVNTTGTQTLTNKTLTAPTITLATMSATIDGEWKRCSTQVDKTSSAVLANITGLTAWTLVAGATYQFEVNIHGVCTTNGGIGLALKYTTATLTSIEYSSTTFAAASMAHTRGTTTTDATLITNSKAAAWLGVHIEGMMIVNAGGTVAVQVAQETSHADTTSVYVGSNARFTRTA